MKKILFLFGSSVGRLSVGSGESFRLYGSDRAAQYGVHATTDIVRNAETDTSMFAKLLDTVLNALCNLAGGRGGTWTRVLRSRNLIKQTELVVSTVDRVGVPLLILMTVGIIPTRPVVYISVGLPERLRAMRPWFRKHFISLLRDRVEKIICYGYGEHQLLHDMVKNPKEDIIFQPFGVDINHFSPSTVSKKNESYLITVGADPHRDFETLLAAADKISMPWEVITSQARYDEILAQNMSVPETVSIHTDVSLEEMKTRMQGAVAVVLPLKNNSYSGATTVMLQALALGKPIIVSRVDANRDGYHLQNEKNCLLVQPGDVAGLVSAVEHVMERSVSEKLSQHARKTAETYFFWDRFCDELYAIILLAYAKRTV